MVTELDAWKLIREAYATPVKQRADRQTRIGLTGICFAVKHVLSLDAETEERMLARVNKALRGLLVSKVYLAPYQCPAGDAVRVAFCDKQIARLEAESK
jgi:hypothetical protein